MRCERIHEVGGWTLRNAAHQPTFSRKTSLRRVGRFARRQHCNALTLAETIIAIAILVTLVWGVVAFITGGRVATEKAGEQRKAVQVAMQQLETTRHLAYASIASTNGTQTVDGVVYTWTLTATASQSDPADGGSVYKQVKVSVTWPTPGTSAVVLSTGIPP